MNAYPIALDNAAPLQRRARARSRGEAAAIARGSIYDEVTTRIARELEAGCVPWARPWDAAAYAPGLHALHQSSATTGFGGLYG